MSRILVIDDDPGNRLIVKSRLADLGFEVQTADTGASGLVEARNASSDLVMVAAALGSGIDATEVCRRLKAMPETVGVPVLLISSIPVGNEQLARAYEAGCDGFVDKHQMGVLDHIVRAALRNKSAQEDLAEQNRVLGQQNRRLKEEHQRSADRETSLKESGEASLVFRELAAGRPDGVLLVDGEGFVRQADRGACEFFGNRIEGRKLGSLAPASRLEAFVRDARSEAREGFRFDLSAISGRPARSLTASVVPLVSSPGDDDEGLKVVLLLDAGRRRIAAEMLRIAEPGIPMHQLGPLLEAAHEVYNVHALVGTSETTLAARRAVEDFAKKRECVLIVGEDGVGKADLARILHYDGGFSGPFYHVRCSATEPKNLERDLFGVAKGASKDTTADRPGIFQQAADGTVFLEDVGDLPLELQERLVRVLEDGELSRVGSDRAEKVHVRLIATTGASLEPAVKEGTFSKKLAGLLGERLVELPPLRERREDVIPLVMRHVAQYGPTGAVREITDDALAYLSSYDWPGNLVELRDAVRTACAHAEDGVILPESLPQTVRDACEDLAQREVIPQARRTDGAGTRGTHTVGATSGAAMAGAGIRPKHTWDITDDDPISLEHYEMKALMRALDAVDGDKLAAARLLNVGKSTLYRKLKRFGIS